MICGNLASEQADPPPGGLPGGSYASGVDGVLIRASLLEASQRRWEITSLDVKSAFLQAPRPHQPGGKPVAVQPPKVMVDLGVCEPDEVWLIRKALYGFNTSPSYWAIYRDQVLEELATTTSPTT